MARNGGSCGKGRTYFAGFVLSNLVLSVLLAVLALAIGTAGFGYVDLGRQRVLALGLLDIASSFLCGPGLSSNLRQIDPLVKHVAAIRI